MGGDLNLKKSWHPNLMKNQQRVWEEEKKQREELKRLEQVRKEIEEQRQLEELQRLQEQAGGKKVQEKVSWMYAGPSTGEGGTTEEMEAYLLGKRRIDNLLKGSENDKLKKGADETSFMQAPKVNQVRDMANKIREDPLLAIKRQEQATYEELLKDPSKRRRLLGQAGIKVEKKEKKHKDRDGDRRSTHHDDGRDRKRRRDDDDDGNRSRRDKGRRRDDSRDRRSRRDRRDRSTSSSRSVSPRHHDRDRRRDRSRSRDRPSRSHRDKSRDRSRERRRKFSDSPPRRDSGRKDRSSPPRSARDVRDRSRSRSPHRRKDGYRDNNRDRRQDSRNYNSRHAVSASKNSQSELDEERARKLAAMQSNAQNLESERLRRLDEIAEKEKIELEKEERARMESSKYGGKGRFMSGIQAKAGEISLEERVRRGRGGLERIREDD